MSALTDSLETLKTTTDENKEKRQKVCQFGSDDMLLEKNLLAFLEDLLSGIKKTYANAAIVGEISKELQKNERLSKEFIVEQLTDMIKSNSVLTQAKKMELMNRLGNEKLQKDMTNISNFVLSNSVELAHQTKADFLSKNPNASSEDIKSKVIDNIEKNLLRASDMVEALGSGTKIKVADIAKQAIDKADKAVDMAQKVVRF